MVVPAVEVAALLLVVVGCGDGKSADAPTPANSDPSADVAEAIPGMDFPESETVPVSPTAAVTPKAGFIHSEGALDLALGDAARVGMDTISNGLGYALVPNDLPADFTLTMARLVEVPGSPLATVFYESRGRRLTLFYPAIFRPDFEQQTKRPGDFTPPGDAVVRVVVAGELAYVMKGEWDERTVQLLASYTAQWEYNGRLTLYFEYDSGLNGRQWAMLSSNTQFSDWIRVGGLIAIAESMSAVQ